tara:strand:- start:3423 stop:4511 length:1089 start_codon:yes stop_codon:yes gene_type:complete
MSTNTFKFEDGRTKLTKKELRTEALKIKQSVPKGTSWTSLVIQQFGKPYWDEAGDPVKNAADGKPYLMTNGGGDKIKLDLEETRKATIQRKAQTRNDKLKIQPETETLIKNANVEGKTVKDFKKILSNDNIAAANERKTLSIITGKPHDKGHGNAVATGGSDRITNTSPEESVKNSFQRQHSGRKHADLEEADIGHKQINAAANYLIDGEPELDVGTRTKIHQGKEDINKVLAEVNTPKVKETKRQLKHVFKGLADAAGTSNNPLANVGGDLVGVFFDGVAYAQNPNMQTGLDLLMSGSEAVTSLGAMGLSAVPIPGARVAAYALMKAGDNISKANQILQIGREGISKIRGKTSTKALKIKK